MKPVQLDLSDLIDRLEREAPTKVVQLGLANPHSYRGDYADLAFETAQDVSVASMLAAARSALGATYQGWKGGDYRMDRYSMVWLVDQEGECGETLGAVLLELLLAAGEERS